MHAWKRKDNKEDLEGSLKPINRKRQAIGKQLVSNMAILDSRLEVCSTCFLLRDRKCLSGGEFILLD